MIYGATWLSLVERYLDKKTPPIDTQDVPSFYRNAQRRPKFEVNPRVPGISSKEFLIIGIAVLKIFSFFDKIRFYVKFHFFFIQKFILNILYYKFIGKSRLFCGNMFFPRFVTQKFLGSSLQSVVKW